MPNLFRHLKDLNKIPKQVRDDSIADFSGNGWGGRTRTLEWRYQKPLPYHLATPQKSHLLCATLTAVFPKCKGICRNTRPLPINGAIVLCRRNKEMCVKERSDAAIQ